MSVGLVHIDCGILADKHYHSLSRSKIASGFKGSGLGVIAVSYEIDHLGYSREISDIEGKSHYKKYSATEICKASRIQV